MHLHRCLTSCNNLLIPYGGDHVLRTSVTGNHIKKYPFLKEKYAISVSRAQEDNMIHIVLEAFESLLPTRSIVEVQYVETPKILVGDTKELAIQLYDLIIKEKPNLERWWDASTVIQMFWDKNQVFNEAKKLRDQLTK